MKNRKSILFLMIVVLAVSLVGCSNKEEIVEKTPEANIESEVAEIEVLEFTDMAGREIVLDGPRDRIVTLGSSLRMYTYINGTDRLVGVESAQQNLKTGRPFILANPELQNIDSVGEGFPADVDPELIILADPDLIIAGNLDIKTIEELEKKTGVPVVMVTSGKLAVFDEDMYESMKIIGKIVDKEERAEEIVAYLEASKEELINLTKDIPEEEKPSVYIGGLSYKGNHGIESTRGNSEILNVIHAKNVADELDSPVPINIDKEQLIKWDPEIIIIDENGLGLVKEDYDKNPSFYDSLSAFKNKRVYGQLPYISSNSNIETALADTYYVGSILYPEVFKNIDPIKKADEIYKFMLGTELYDIMADQFGGYIEIEL